jgi:hypothetical protein
MRHIQFIVLIIALSSCQSNSDKQPSLSSIKDTTIEKVFTDSLDLDTSSFITTLFPDTVKRILYSSNDSGWLCVESFYLRNQSRKAGIDSLTKVMASSQFEIDTSAKSILFWKKKFNRRFGVEIQGSTIDTISVINQAWYLGKRYLLITTKYKDWKT